MSEFFRFPDFGEKSRSDACTLCGSGTGLIVGAVNYIGLGVYDLVQCPECGLASFDPMPGADIFSEGYDRYYRWEQAGFGRERVLKLFGRSFRRGRDFARHYLPDLFPNGPGDLLEVGAGNGYFAHGIKHIYPEMRVTCIDIVDEVAAYLRRQFDCEAIAGEFTSGMFPAEKFDLITMRDLLEHVRDPLELLKEAHRVLKPGGYLHFITPNGLEDGWMISQRYIHDRKPALRILNHVHYFLPQTLDRLLEASGFTKEIAFKWELKFSRRGFGHKQVSEFAEERVPEAPDIGDASEGWSASLWEHDTDELLSMPRNKDGILSRLYDAYRYRERGRVDYYDPRGRSFFLMAKKILESHFCRADTGKTRRPPR